MSNKRRPLARLRKFHKGKRGISQQQAHTANLRREMRENDSPPSTGVGEQG